MYKGFESFVNRDSHVLILGSFPSVMSRETLFYYGNPRNRFWKIIASLNNDEIPETIDDKKDLLIKNRIALYDMVKECDIKGSLDVNIKNPPATINNSDIKKLIDDSNISHIILNGNLAFELFREKCSDYMDIAIKLPSTSPANTKLDINMWVSTLKTFLKN